MFGFKKNIGIRLRKVIIENKEDRDLYVKLFCIRIGEKATLYRLGYYYGSKIVEIVNKNNDINSLLSFKYKDYEKYINGYFNIELQKDNILNNNVEKLK